MREAQLKKKAKQNKAKNIRYHKAQQGGQTQIFTHLIFMQFLKRYLNSNKILVFKNQLSYVYQ